MQKEIIDKFTKEVVKQTQNIRIGDPLLEDTRMGPLINGPHLERVLGFIKSAKEEVRNERELGRGRLRHGSLPQAFLHLLWWLVSMSVLLWEGKCCVPLLGPPLSLWEHIWGCVFNTEDACLFFFT